MIVGKDVCSQSVIKGFVLIVSLYPGALQSADRES